MKAYLLKNTTFLKQTNRSRLLHLLKSPGNNMISSSFKNQLGKTNNFLTQMEGLKLAGPPFFNSHEYDAEFSVRLALHWPPFHQSDSSPQKGNGDLPSAATEHSWPSQTILIGGEIPVEATPHSLRGSMLISFAILNVQIFW